MPLIPPMPEQPPRTSGPGGTPIPPQPAPGRGDCLLGFRLIPVLFAGEATSRARAEGNNAAWYCRCHFEENLDEEDRNVLPLIGRCYYAFGHICHTICPRCETRYQVWGNKNRQAIVVVQHGVSREEVLARWAAIENSDP